jgi:hypothetical protein
MFGNKSRPANTGFTSIVVREGMMRKRQITPQTDVNATPSVGWTWLQ